MPYFTQDTLDFLADLADNNDRDWFNANKKRYETHVKDAALAFIRDFEQHLHAISPHFLAVAKAQGGSMFRIYRDTRFSKDKRPYKTNTGLQFRHAQASRDMHAPGFYLHIEPGKTGAGVGMWHPATPALKAVRDAIVADPDRWRRVKAELDSADMSFMGESLKRPPRGYDKDHPHVEDLKRKDLAVHCTLSDDAVISDDLPQRFAEACRGGAPLVAFLCEAVDLPY